MQCGVRWCCRWGGPVVQHLSNTLHAVQSFSAKQLISCNFFWGGSVVRVFFCPGYASLCFSFIRCFPTDHHFEVLHGVWSCLFDVYSFVCCFGLVCKQPILLFTGWCQCLKMLLGLISEDSWNYGCPSQRCSSHLQSSHCGKHRGGLRLQDGH